MKTIQMMGLTVGAMLAFVAGLATTASAETTLLAEWLLNGNAVSGTVPTKVEGEVLLEDKTFKVAITCSGILTDGLAKTA